MNQKREDITQAEENLTANLQLLETILYADLQNAGYQEIEPFLDNWVSLYQSRVDYLDLTAGNGFVFFRHGRQEPTDHFISRTVAIQYSYQSSATLSVRWNLTDAHFTARRTLMLLGLIQLITTLTLVFFLRLAMQRKRDSRMLSERARDLDLANQDLHQEMEERTVIEENLAIEKEQLQVTLRSLEEGVILIDCRGFILLTNSAAEEMTGCRGQLCIGKSIDEVLDLVEEGSESVFRLVESGLLLKTGGATKELVMRSLDHKSRFVSLSCSHITNDQDEITGVVVVIRDITKTRSLEQEQHKNSMLEALGVLAGGIAHDFNNILMAISGNLNMAQELIQEPSGDDAELQDILSNAEKATDRAADLTRQLLTFAKGGSPILDATAIDGVIRESADFVTHGADIHLEYDFEPDLLPVLIDRHQIGQVIQNLVINARQAMSTGGSLTITGSNSIEKQGDLETPMVLIEITDQGSGIPEPDLGHIFDPYFTTKKEGSGLGLAVVHSIIARHQGRIEVRSRLGEGSTFTIHLPASRKALSTPDQDMRSLIRGTGRVLVMDDDDAVRLITCRMVRELGFEVIEADQGARTIELYRDHLQRRQTIDLVIMDLTVPQGMGGQETIRQLLEIDPECRAIVSSGYSNDPVMANHLDYGFKAALVKPFSLRQLSRLLGKVLDQS
ncbi:MAG: response regulator [Gemmatimonadales bacterium]|nr:response regulator [Gemmatimonadales bacterium]